MALLIKNFKVKGITIPEVYVKLLNVQATKYNGVNGMFGCYASKEMSDEKIENILDHFNVHCDFEDGNVWSTLYNSVKNNEPFKSHEIVDV